MANNIPIPIYRELMQDGNKLTIDVLKFVEQRVKILTPISRTTFWEEIFGSLEQLKTRLREQES